MRHRHKRKVHIARCDKHTSNTGNSSMQSMENAFARGPHCNMRRTHEQCGQSPPWRVWGGVSQLHSRPSSRRRCVRAWGSFPFATRILARGSQSGNSAGAMRDVLRFGRGGHIVVGLPPTSRGSQACTRTQLARVVPVQIQQCRGRARPAWVLANERQLMDRRCPA